MGHQDPWSAREIDYGVRKKGKCGKGEKTVNREQDKDGMARRTGSGGDGSIQIWRILNRAITTSSSMPWMEMGGGFTVLRQKSGSTTGMGIDKHSDAPFSASPVEIARADL